MAKGGYVLYFDGSCIPNPGGPGCYGFVLLTNNGTVIDCGFGVAEDNSTNNRSEYFGLIHGLTAARKHGIRHLTVRGDSMLVINQMNRIFKVKSPSLQELYITACTKAREFATVKFEHISERDNPAHELAQRAYREL